MKKILFILQILLKLGLVFSISFIWLRFFLKSVWLSLTISIGISILFEICHTRFKRKNKNQENLKIKEKEDADNIFLSLLTENNYINFFENMFKSRHNKVLTKKSYLVIHKNEKKIVFYPYIKYENLKPNQMVEIMHNVKQEKADKLIISCFDYDKDVLIFLKNFKEDILILNRYETYSLYKEYEYFPEITQQYKKEARLSFKDLLAFAFNKSRTKGYLFSSLILFVTSFFVKINIYYCIISSLLLIFALISYLNPKYNQKSINEFI